MCALQVRYVLKNFMRDWSTEGAAEREASYGWISRAAATWVPRAAGGEPPRVLVPGCGLARLPVELAALGFDAVGNEFSFFMLVACRCVLSFSLSLPFSASPCS